MFEKRKTNYKIRFQDSGFKRRLERQRKYKRPLRAAPKSGWGVFLVKAGLGSWAARFASLLVFLLLIYVIFIPNIFFIKHLTLNGADQFSQTGIEKSINSFLNKATPWPQKNLLLLSKTNLSNYLLKNNQKVLKVNKISKKFPATLIVDVTPRTDQFAIQTLTSVFSVSNDGLVTGVLEPTASSALPSGLILIKLKSNAGLKVGEEALAEDYADFMAQLRSPLQNIIKSEINYYEMPDLQTPDLTVYFKNGQLVLFDLTSDPSKTLDSLRLLFSQFTKTELKNLYYADMRFEDRGYVCYKGTACVKDINLPGGFASSSPSSAQ